MCRMVQRCSIVLLAAVAMWGVAVGSAFAQSGRTTGSINGKVDDASGGVLPGVTVTAKSPALIGVQTAVTDAGGNYRFPSLPPGVYSLTYELTGFRTAARQDIQITIGFTATVNVELGLATVNESVQVTAEAPIIDSSSTHVKQSFNQAALQEIPASRDLWSMLALTPSMHMSKIDVGGSHAGDQFGYTAYGFTGQYQLFVEGINITYNTTTSSLYMDFGSFDEVSVGTIGQGAQVATGGVQSQMVVKSGGNVFHGGFYQDFEANHLQGANIPQSALDRGVREHSNELDKYRDLSFDGGGPIKVDKMWWYASYHNQKIDLGRPNFVGPIGGKTFDTDLWNLSGKATYQINPKHKLIGYYQWSNKNQPNNNDVSFLYTDLGPTWTQPIRSWIYKGEWDGTFTDNMFAEVLVGNSSVSASHISNTDTTAFEQIDSGRATILNGATKDQFIFRRPQVTGTINYFKDGMAGSHTFKVGGTYDRTIDWSGNLQVGSGHVQELFNNGQPVSISIDAPTATHVGDVFDGPNGNLLSVDRITVSNAYVTDQWAVGRATINAGVRWDRYHAWSPEQRQLAFALGPVNIPASTFPAYDFFTWNNFVPRLGLAYKLTADGNTVAKVSYGRFAFDPGIGMANNANPNQSKKTATYAWSDSKPCAGCIAGDHIYQPGEEGAQLANALAGSIHVDPNLKQPLATQTTAYLEQQLTNAIGTRFGFVYYTVKNQVSTYQPFRPASAYTVPFNVADPVTGNQLTFYGIPNGEIANYPATTVLQAAPNNGTYKTIEVALTKRQTRNYAFDASANYTWQTDYPGGYPNTPNGPFQYDHSIYNVQAHATYMLPWRILLSGVYRFQAGDNYARTLTVRAPASCNCTFSAAAGDKLGNTTIFATPFNAYRNDNVSVIDLRVEKVLKFGRMPEMKLFLDGFNLGNAYAAETISTATGPAFQKPTAVISPRTARLGLRVVW